MSFFGRRTQLLHVHIYIYVCVIKYTSIYTHTHTQSDVMVMRKESGVLINHQFSFITDNADSSSTSAFMLLPFLGNHGL